jgi:predicted trehalose synthase
MERGGPLRRLAGMVQLIDYASVYLGIASGIDPLAIAAIKDLRDLTGRE